MPPTGKDPADTPHPAAANQAKPKPEHSLAEQINAHILALDHQKKAARLAELARLELTDEEAATYQAQLSRILEHVERLKSIDVSGIEPTARIVRQRFKNLQGF